ncbi:MAG: FMN-binding protein [Deltaproteobacteria bacterium]|nr:MAG: FMN-binding protein [Deltaproteobacteria bacterium]
MTAIQMEQSFGQRLKNSNIVQAWLVLTLALLFGAALAGIQISLAPTIEANKINETRQKVPELIFGKTRALEMAAQNKNLHVTPQFIAVEKQGKKVFYNVFKADMDGKCVGWVVKTNGQGYADKIELLIGLAPDAETITGLFILDQKETPGLGNKIVTEKWRSQFIGKPTGTRLTVTKTGAVTDTEINAVTGATISSRSAINIINTAVGDLKGPLTAKAK